MSPIEKNKIDDLIIELNNSNTEAFSLLFELYWQKTFDQALSLVQNDSIAKDIAQEIWIRIWNRRTNLHSQNFEAYLHKSVRNNCYKHFRSTKFNFVQLEVIDSLKIVSPSSVNQHHDLEAIKEKINQVDLPKRCKQIFQLSRYESMSNEEIASHFGISKRTVENQISRALNALRKVIR